MVERVNRLAESYSRTWQSGSVRWYFSAILLFTAGIGNVIYASYISRWNRERGL